MAKPMRKGTSSSRKPPEPTDSHAEIEDWMGRAMPDLQPLLVRIDELLREELPSPQYALKWKKAYYGVPDQGWVVEVVAYDVSVNVVFHGGADFDSPPPLGDSDRSRYLKLRSLDELDEDQLRAWIRNAATVPGWS